VASPLNYSSAEHASNTLTLVESGDEMRLIFPPAPRWMRRLNAAVAITIPTFIALELAYLAWRLWRFNLQSGLPLHAAAPAFAFPVIGGALSTLIAVFVLVRDQRIGHLSDVLSACDGRLTWTRHGLWRMRRRSIRVDQLNDVTIKPLTDILRRRHFFVLVFRFKSRRPFSLRLKTNDPNLPERITAAIRRELHLVTLPQDQA
jgi:hypothetical protein